MISASQSVVSTRQQRRSVRRITIARASGLDEGENARDPFDCSAYLKEIAVIEKEVDRSTIESAALNALDITLGHHKRQHTLANCFAEGCAKIRTKDGKSKWGKILELVDNPYYMELASGSSMEHVPRCFVVLSGNVTNDKIKLANNMAIDWQMHHKKSESKKGLAPGTPVNPRTWNFVLLLHTWQSITVGIILMQILQDMRVV